MAEEAGEPRCLEWAWAGAAFDGYPESGDLHVVAALPHGALLAVIDGLGHGAEAAEVARSAADLVRANQTRPLEELFQQCHEGLRSTRGVVMSVAAVDAQNATLAWFGVGNVEAVLLRARPTADRHHEAITTRGGVLGFRLPPPTARTCAISPGDLLIFATDGLEADFAREVPIDWEPRAIADWMLSRYGRGTDDALVLVARYLGASH